MLTLFAGPVFETVDSLYFLVFLAILSLPFIFTGVGVILLIRDVFKKQLHRSTVVFFGIGLLLFLIFKMASGII